MSPLVDYDDDDDDDDEEFEEEEVNQNSKEKLQEEEEKKTVDPPSIAWLPPQRNLMTLSSDQLSNPVFPAPSLQMEKLPDASLLFSSASFPLHQTIVTDHSSTVAASFAASESRKRESNGTASAYRRHKFRRGHLQHSRNIPDVAGGKLIPPQLRGRSNVATEDISKLFVRKDGQNLPRSN